MKNKNGIKLTSDEEIMKEMKSYYEKLYMSNMKSQDSINKYLNKIIFQKNLHSYNLIYVKEK